MNLARKQLKRFLYRFYGGSASIDLETLGSDDTWTLSLQSLNSKSNILCAGVGRMISFELELCDRIGCGILLLDPSPTGAYTIGKIEKANPGKLNGIEFLNIGLAGRDEKRGFESPMSQKEGSFQMKLENSGLDDEFQFPCRSLASIMAERGWDEIDFLKMDIEGFEYEVIDEILDRSIDVRQICVEFHTDRAFQVKQTQFDLHRYLRRMRKAGYLVTHVNGRDHSFVHRSCLESLKNRS